MDGGREGGREWREGQCVSGSNSIDHASGGREGGGKGRGQSKSGDGRQAAGATDLVTRGSSSRIIRSRRLTSGRAPSWSSGSSSCRGCAG